MTALLLAPDDVAPNDVAEIERQIPASYTDDMTTNPTATIRVPLRTRKLLGYLAKWQGVSVSSYVATLTVQEFRSTVLRAAHEEALMDEANPAAREEYELWEETWDDIPE